MPISWRDANWPRPSSEPAEMRSFRNWCREHNDDEILVFALWILECASENTSDEVQSQIQAAYTKLLEFTRKRAAAK